MQRQMQAGAVVALVLMLGSWVSMGAAHDPKGPIEHGSKSVIEARVPVVPDVLYDVETSTPDGLAQCVIDLVVKGKKGTSYNLTISTVPAAGGGEATAAISPDIIGAGVEPLCDIFFNAPNTTSFPDLLESRTKHLTFDLFVHSHPDDNCSLGFNAVGAIKFALDNVVGRLRRAQARLVSCEPIAFEDVPPDLLK